MQNCCFECSTIYTCKTSTNKPTDDVTLYKTSTRHKHRKTWHFLLYCRNKKLSDIFCGEKIKHLVMCQFCVAGFYLTCRNNNFIK